MVSKELLVLSGYTTKDKPYFCASSQEKYMVPLQRFKSKWWFHSLLIYIWCLSLRAIESLIFVINLLQYNGYLSLRLSDGLIFVYYSTRCTKFLTHIPSFLLMLYWLTSHFVLMKFGIHNHHSRINNFLIYGHSLKNLFYNVLSTEHFKLRHWFPMMANNWSILCVYYWMILPGS